MARLDGKVAIVTGAGQGVGRGIALALAAKGAAVVVTGRTLAKCEAVADEITGRGRHARAVGCDVESRAEVDTMIASALATFGHLDIVVNNAQSLVYKSVRKITEDDMNSMWQSGPMGTLRVMQAAYDALRASRGCVINLGSGSSILPNRR